MGRLRLPDICDRDVRFHRFNVHHDDHEHKHLEVDDNELQRVEHHFHNNKEHHNNNLIHQHDQLEHYHYELCSEHDE